MPRKRRTQPLPVGAFPARPGQVVKALAMLAGNVDLWEADHRERTLDMYLRGRAPGQRNPLGNLRQYRQFDDLVQDAATVLRLGWHPHDETAPIPVTRVPYPALEETTLAHEFTAADRDQLTMVLSPGDYLP